MRFLQKSSLKGKLAMSAGASALVLALIGMGLPAYADSVPEVKVSIENTDAADPSTAEDETPSEDQTSTQDETPSEDQTSTEQSVQRKPHDDPPQHVKVTICDRTNSASNPYNQITVDDNSVDGAGHGDHYSEHTGPVATTLVVAQTLKDAHTKWGDIIPPLDGVHDGLNWTTEGQAIWNNECSVPDVAPVVKQEVGFYLYPKLDASLPAAWDNSGTQIFCGSQQGSDWFTAVPCVLPPNVCGAGWAYQMDKVKDWAAAGAFAWPATITWPTDNIGWPPIYDAQHGDLSTLITVPACPPVIPPTVVTCPSPVADGGTSTDVDANGWVEFASKPGGTTSYIDGGLALNNADGNSKVSLAHANPNLTGSIANIGQIAVDYTHTSSTTTLQSGPGLNVFVTFAPGLTGTLVGEPNAYPGQDFWLTGGSNAAIVGPQTGGGYGSNRHGTIDEWLALYPEAIFTPAANSYFAFAYGTGGPAAGVLHSVTIGCIQYFFDKGYVAPSGDLGVKCNNAATPVIPTPGSTVTVNGTGGSEDENLLVYVGTDLIGTVSAPAGTAFEESFLLGEDSYDGEAIVQVFLEASPGVPGDLLTDRVSHDTDCEQPGPTSPPTTPPTTTSTGGVNAGIDGPAPSSSVSAPQNQGSNPWLMGTGVLLLLAALGALGYLILGPGRPRTAAAASDGDGS